MAKAYSYIRFSTAEQLKGDSRRRQTQLAERYAAARGLELDDSLTYHDLGVSAFRAANIESGRLGHFLEAARAGIVEPGSFLLVESLDRISRISARKALRVLEDICELGITVVTLSDGREYTAETLDNDPTALLLSLFVFIRANEESETKSRRLRAAWDGKRLRVRERPMTGACPAWLYLDRESGAFKVHEDRAEVVRRIFRDTLNNAGRNAIAEALNREGVDTWGAGKKKGQHWRSSYIIKILENPAVLGTMTPHTIEWDEHGKKYRKPMDPVEGYYPAVVDPDTFQRVQDLRQSKNPRRGRHANQGARNLFGGLLVCGRCGATVTRVYKGEGPKGGEYLVCTRAKAGAGCKYKALRYGHAESTFLDAAPWLIAEAPTGNRGDHLDAELQQVDANLLALSDALENLFATLEAAGPSPALTDRLRKLELERETLEKQRQELEAERARTQGPFVDWKLDRLHAALTATPLDRTTANAALRQVLRRIVVDYARGTLACEWIHGGETEVQVWWPEDADAA